MKNIIISVKNLCKSYKIYDAPIDRLKEAMHPLKKKYHKEFFALNDVSFDIIKGDTIGIVGKNGSGKSTLLKIITGVLTQTSGEVKINGKIAALLELGAGFNPEMSGLENIYLTGTLMGYTKKEIEKRVDPIVEFADIGDFINQPVKTYSSGMFARLAFSVNVNVEPDILIVDEALSVGDMFFQQKCIHKMRKMQENGTTIFFVSHALTTVKSLCDKAIYLKNGELIAIGDSESVCNLYQNEMTDKKMNSLNNASIELIYNENSTNIEKCINKFNEIYRVDESFSSNISERSGGGEIVITAFDIYDENEKRNNVISAFHPFKIRVSNQVKKDVPAGAVIGIVCRTDMGIDVFGCNSNIYETYLPAMSSGQAFVYELEMQLPLLPGIYWFHMGIKPDADSNYFYDRCFGAGYLEIGPGDFLKNVNIGGLIYTKPKQIKICMN